MVGTSDGRRRTRVLERPVIWIVSAVAVVVFVLGVLGAVTPADATPTRVMAVLGAVVVVPLVTVGVGRAVAGWGGDRTW